jgi:hypothetical protein
MRDTAQSNATVRMAFELDRMMAEMSGREEKCEVVGEGASYVQVAAPRIRRSVTDLAVPS